MKTIIPILLLPFLGTTLGAGTVFFLKNQLNKNFEKLLLGFASGVMVAASVWSLIMPAIESSEAMGKLAFLPAAVGVALGMAFLFLLDKIIPHLHINTDVPDGPKSQLKKTNMLVLAVTLHNIPEGLAVGFSFGLAYAVKTDAAYISALLLSIGIGIQNFPEGAAVALPLKKPLKSPNKAFLVGVCSGAIEPLFAILGFCCVAALQFLQPWLLAFSAGTMVFVVVEDLLPDMQERTLGSCFFIMGFALMMSLDVVFG